MNKRRWGMLLLAGLLTVPLAACGKKDPGGASSSAPPDEPAVSVIAPVEPEPVKVRVRAELSYAQRVLPPADPVETAACANMGRLQSSAAASARDRMRVKTFFFISIFSSSNAENKFCFLGLV